MRRPVMLKKLGLYVSKGVTLAGTLLWFFFPLRQRSGWVWFFGLTALIGLSFLAWKRLETGDNRGWSQETPRTKS